MTTIDDERKAERMNAKADSAAPLLAWGGLVEHTTADEQAMRRVEAKEANFWATQARAEHEAQQLAEVSWLRLLIHLTAGSEEADRVSRWADAVARELAYVRLGCWRRAFASMLAGDDTVPGVGKRHPTACWPSVEAVLLSGDEPVPSGQALRGEWARHDAAGCTKEWCVVTGSERPDPIDLRPIEVSP